MPDELVHHCDYSSQPNIHIVCSDKWTTPEWSMDKVKRAKGVYVDDEGDLYSFDPVKVTCPDCQSKGSSPVIGSTSSD